MTEYNKDTWNNPRSPGNAGDILQIEYEDDFTFNENELGSEDDLITRVEDQLKKKTFKVTNQEPDKQNKRKLLKISESASNLCLDKHDQLNKHSATTAAHKNKQCKNLLDNNDIDSTSYSGKPLFPILEECDKFKNKPKFADLDKFRIELSCSGNRKIIGPKTGLEFKESNNSSVGPAESGFEMYSPSSDMEPFVDSVVTQTTTEMRGGDSPSSPSSSEALSATGGRNRGHNKRNRRSPKKNRSSSNSVADKVEAGHKKEADRIGSTRETLHGKKRRNSGQQEISKKRESSPDNSRRQKSREGRTEKRQSRQESDCSREEGSSSRSATSPSKKVKSSSKKESEFSRDVGSPFMKESRSSRQDRSPLKNANSPEIEYKSTPRAEKSPSRAEKNSARAEKSPPRKERDNSPITRGSNVRRVVRGKLNRSLFKTSSSAASGEPEKAVTSIQKQNFEAEEEKKNILERERKEIAEEEKGNMAGRFGERKRRTEIYIGNYPERFREPDVRRLFEDNGIKVGSIRLKQTGPKVYAFAETESSEMIDKAKSVMEGKEIGGRKLRVRSSRDKRERSADGRWEGDESAEGGERVIGGPGSEDDRAIGDSGDRPLGDEDDRALHYGDLCRFFVKQLKREGADEVEAQRVGTVMVDCWRAHNYEFHELEEMYLINMEQNDDRDLLGKELGKTLGEGKLPQGLTPGRLVTLTLEFFASEPRMEEMLRRGGGSGGQPEETTFRRSEDIGIPDNQEDRFEDQTLDERKMAKTKKRELELPPRPEIKTRPKRPKMSKFDSLKPISNFLENMLIKNGVDAANVELIVFDITARFVTAGYGWDKILMYHSKGEEKFVRKLLPYLQKSTSEFPDHMTCQDVLSLTFEFIDDWKFKLFNMIYKEQEDEVNEIPERPSNPGYAARPENSPQHSHASGHSPRRPAEKITENSAISKERIDPKKKEWVRDLQKNEQDQKYAERKPRSYEEEKKPPIKSLDDNRKPSMRSSDEDRRLPGRPPYEEERKFHPKPYEEERRPYGKQFEDQGRAYLKQYSHNDEDRRPFPRHSEEERRPYYDEDKRYHPKHFSDERRPSNKREFADKKYKPTPRAMIMGPRGNVAPGPPNKYGGPDREKHPERWKRGPNEESRRVPHQNYPRENQRDERNQEKYSKKEEKNLRKEEAKSRNGKLSSTEYKSDDGKTTYYHYSDEKPEADCSPPRERKHSQSSLSSSMQNILLKKENESRRAKIKSVRSKKKRDGSSSSRSRDRKSSSSRERKSSSSDSEREDSHKMNETKGKRKKLVKSVSPRDRKSKVISPKTKTSKKEAKRGPLKNEAQKADIKKDNNGSESSDDNTSGHDSKYNNEDETEIRHVRRISSDVEQSDSDAKEKPSVKSEGKKAQTLLEKVNEIIKSCVVLKKTGQEKPKPESKEYLKEAETKEEEDKEDNELENMDEQKDMPGNCEIKKESEIKKEKESEKEEELEKEKEIKQERESIELKDSKKEHKKERDARKEKEIKEEKGVKLNHIDHQDEDADGSLESGELNSDAENTDHDISIDIFDEEDKKLEAKLKLEKKKKVARTVTIVKKKKIESLKLARKKLLASKMKNYSDKSSDEENSETMMATMKKLRQSERHHRKRSPASGSSSKSRSRSLTRYKRMSRSRSWSREKRRDFDRSRSWSRERGRLQKRWSRSRSRERHSRSPHAQGLRQDFAHRGFQTTNKWIPIAPCTLLDDMEIEQQSSMMVDISIKGEFSFKENCGCMVRITKWTGRDAVRNIEIRPQIVTLEETNVAQIEIENPFPSKNLFLQKGDKVACISILSAPTYPGLFAGLTSPVDTYRTATKKWFRVASVVLHRKGGLDRITIPPGRTMKVIATCIGPLSKYIGKEVLITKLDKFDEFPVKAQISQIFENENIGIDVINKTNRTIIIEKCGKAVAVLGVWSVVKIDPENIRY